MNVNQRACLGIRTENGYCRRPMFRHVFFRHLNPSSKLGQNFLHRSRDHGDLIGPVVWAAREHVLVALWVKAEQLFH